MSFFIPKKIRERVRFISSFDEIDVIDPNNLLQEMGGTLEWSSKEWVDEQKRLEEKGGNHKSLSTMGVVPGETNSAVGTGITGSETEAASIEQDEC